MRGDYSRVTFRPDKHYSGVRLQQGRVQLDADFNEHVDIEAYRDAETTRDVVGPYGAPFDGGGFALSVSFRLRDVGLQDSTGWAVGEDGLLLELTGGGWMLRTAPADARSLNSVHLSGADAGMLVGDDARIYTLSARTPAWTRESAPAGVTASLNGVFAIGAPVTEAWAVGERATILYRSSTDGWVEQAAPENVTATLRAVHFSDANNGFAVGDGATILATTDGATWTQQDAPSVTRDLHGIFAIDPTHAWAVGDDGLILFYDGNEWTVQATQAEASLHAVFFSDAQEGIAIGEGVTALATIDGGGTWTLSGINGVGSGLVGIDGTRATTVAVGTDVIASSPAGGWTPSAEQLPSPGKSLTLSEGDMYVEGVRVVNDRTATLGRQPDFRETSAPTTSGLYGIYLKVFEQHLTALEREELREVALGGPDTATRTRTVWQAKTKKLDDSATCAAFAASMAQVPPEPASAGTLRAQAQPGEDSAADDCGIALEGGYRRLENQLYRVEIHDPGDAGTATYKWSRENGSVVARLEGVDSSSGTVTVSTAGRDDVLGVAPGQWIELKDEGRELRGDPGTLLQIKLVRGMTLEIEPASLPTGLSIEDFPDRPIVRRWEGRGLVVAGQWTEIEDGVQVEFGGHAFQSGDYWVIPARSSTGTVEWPRSGNVALPQPPAGGRARYAPIGLATLGSDGLWSAPVDCRKRFAPLTGLVQLYYVGGDGQEATPDPTLAEPRFVKLDQPLEVGVSNWRWPVENAVIEFTVTGGDGRLKGTSLTTVQAPTNTAGIASVDWFLNGSLAAPIITQQVEAWLLDDDGKRMGTPIHFDASLSVAHEVAFDGTGCGTLASDKTVQAALTKLARLTRLFPASGTGFDLGTTPVNEAPLELAVIVLNECGAVSQATVTFAIESGSGTLTTTSATTGADGITTTSWTPDATTPTQVVKATLANAGTGNVKHLPDTARFVVNLALASDTRYSPPAGCAALSDSNDVDSALDRLATFPSLHVVGGDEPRGRPGDVITLTVGADSACGPFDAGTVQFAVVEGADGTFTGPNPASLQNGQASCAYRVGSQPRQRVQAVLSENGSQALHAPVYFDVTLLRAADVSYDASKCKTLGEAGVDNVQDALDALCTRAGTERPGVRITGIRLNDAKKTPLWLYENVPANALENGILIDCDGPIDGRALSGLPNVLVTVDVPYPLGDERDFWQGRELVGTTEVVLYGNTDNVVTGIIWVPSERSREWLSTLLMQQLGEQLGIKSVTAHLRVNGNYIWQVPTPDTEGRYLDAELFAAIPAGRRGQVELGPFGSNVLLSAGNRLAGVDTTRILSAAALTNELGGRILRPATAGSPRFPSGDGQAGGLTDLCFQIMPPAAPLIDAKLTVGGIAIATGLTGATLLKSAADVPEFSVADPPRAIQIEFVDGAPDPETLKLGTTVLVTDAQGAEVPGRLISVAPNLIGFVPAEGFAGNVRVVLRGGSDGIQALATESAPAHPLTVDQPGGDYEFRFSVAG